MEIGRITILAILYLTLAGGVIRAQVPLVSPLVLENVEHLNGVFLFTYDDQPFLPEMEKGAKAMD